MLRDSTHREKWHPNHKITTSWFLDPKTDITLIATVYKMDSAIASGHIRSKRRITPFWLIGSWISGSKTIQMAVNLDRRRTTGLRAKALGQRPIVNELVTPNTWATKAEVMRNKHTSCGIPALNAQGRLGCRLISLFEINFMASSGPFLEILSTSP